MFQTFVYAITHNARRLMSLHDKKAKTPQEWRIAVANALTPKFQNGEKHELVNLNSPHSNRPRCRVCYNTDHRDVKTNSKCTRCMVPMCYHCFNSCAHTNYVSKMFQ
jgi:hypothetical protein